MKPVEDARNNMSRAIEKLKTELSQIRTARASPKLLEGIMVTAYGSKLPLNKLAVISQLEPRILDIKPFDVNIITEIEKAVVGANLGVGVENKKDSIKVTFPPLTEERRRDIVKLIKKIVEEFKVSIRNHRRKAIEDIKKMQKNKEISEDDAFHYEKELDKITQEFTKKIEEVGSLKEKEVLEF